MPAHCAALGDFGYGVMGQRQPIGPRSCYDEGKRCAETLFFDYRRQHKLPIKVARIFNTYGPGMHPADGRVVSNFVIQALRNENITLDHAPLGTGSIGSLNTFLFSLDGSTFNPVTFGAANDGPSAFSKDFHFKEDGCTPDRSPAWPADCRAQSPRHRCQQIAQFDKINKEKLPHAAFSVSGYACD
jgi:hypothetical protein